MTRREKKSESLDVRLPYSVKRRFMEAARSRGETASDAVRRFIATYLDDPAQADPQPFWSDWIMTAQRNLKKTAAVTACLAAGAFALTMLAPASAEDALFKTLDRNSDGQLRPGEIAPDDQDVFSVLDLNRDGVISPSEFVTETSMESVTDNLRTDRDGSPKRLIVVERKSIEIVPGGQLNTWISTASAVVEPGADAAAVDDVVADLKLKLDESEARRPDRG